MPIHREQFNRVPFIYKLSTQYIDNDWKAPLLNFLLLRYLYFGLFCQRAPHTCGRILRRYHQKKKITTQYAAVHFAKLCVPCPSVPFTTKLLADGPRAGLLAQGRRAATAGRARGGGARAGPPAAGLDGARAPVLLCLCFKLV